LAETTIEWAHYTFNPWLGCNRVSPACDACYADAGSKRIAAQRKLKLWDEGSTRHFTSESYWKQPHAWNRKAERETVRKRVFCASFADVFEDRPELVDRRKRLIALIEATPWLDWMLLTKRPENMIPMTAAAWPKYWPSNVWAGTTAESQAYFDRRWEHLRRVPAPVHFVSYEPALAPLSLEVPLFSAMRSHDDPPLELLIVGGESGPKARPFHIEWARAIRNECRQADVAFFFKQGGANVRTLGISRPGEHWPEGTKMHDAGDGTFRVWLKDKKGGDLAEFPEDVRVRDLPWGCA
jgi:protein gp37